MPLVPQLHHDKEAYETSWVLPLRRRCRDRSALMERRYRAVAFNLPRLEMYLGACRTGRSAPVMKMVDRHGFAPCSSACGAGDLLNDRAAQRNLVAGAGIEPAHKRLMRPSPYHLATPQL